MKSKITKLLAALLVCLLLAGCGSTQGAGSDVKSTAPESQTDADKEEAVPQVTAPGEMPITTEPVTFTCLLGKGAEDYMYDPESNVCMKWLLDTTGIDLDMEVVGSGDIATRLQTRMASGDYPDIFWGAGFTNADITNYGVSEQVLLPLNDLIDEYSCYFKTACEEMPNFLNSITQLDGNIYGIPNMEDCYHVSHGYKMWVNVEWLDNLKMEVPETIDEYYDMLVAFRDKDPNGNGLKDEVPLSGASDGWNSDPCLYLLNAFCPYTDRDYAPYMYNDNGTIRTVATMDEYREGLRWLHKLYEEGLMDPNTFTQTTGDILQLTTQETKIMGAMPAGHLAIVTDISDYANEKPYEAIAPVKGPNGRRASFYVPQGVGSGASLAISKECKYPEIAFRFFDYMFSIDYTLNDFVGLGNWEYLPEDTDKKAQDGTKAIVDLVGEARDSSYQEMSAVNNLLFMRPGFMCKDYDYGWFACDTGPEDWNHSNAIVRILGYYTDRYEEYADKESPLGPIVYESEISQELAQLKTSMKAYLDSSRIAFINGEMSLDADWDSYVQTVGDTGMNRMLEIVQEGYDRTYKN